MFDAYQEAMDHEAGCASELQNAFRQSKAEMLIRDETPKITGLRAAGAYVITNEFPVFCPRTDAVLGTSRVVVTTAADLDEANRVLAGLQRDAEQDDNYQVLEPIGRKR